MILAAASPLALIDWPSLGWVALIAAVSFATLTVKARYASIHEMGRGAQWLAHLTVGYFGLGMATFGSWSVANAYFPVPGGAGWEGGLAMIGGLAAFTIGGCTLSEHALQAGALSAETSAVEA
jgi:hypothetical protein